MEMFGPQLRILRNEPIDIFPHLTHQVQRNRISNDGVSVNLVRQGGLCYLVHQFAPLSMPHDTKRKPAVRAVWRQPERGWGAFCCVPPDSWHQPASAVQSAGRELAR